MSASAEQRRRRAEKVSATLALTEKGLSADEVAKALGIPRLTVWSYRNDPDGEKAREYARRRRGVCETCGAETSDPRIKRCAACAPRRGPSVSWTRERVVEAMRAWTLTYGEPPSFRDWTSGGSDTARYRRLKRSGLIASAKTVAEVFGSWNAALEAAGYRPRLPGGQRRPDRRTHCSYGHPLVGENLYLDRHGGRRCRICKKYNQRAHTIRAEARRRGIIVAAPERPPPGLPPEPPPGAHRPGRPWTQEEVVEAIRRFAAEHGRRPKSTDWARPKAERGDYPHISSVARTRHHPNCPFDSWSDAIVAAGFPRPHHSGPKPWLRKKPNEGGSK